MRVVADNSVILACRTLFGGELVITADFLRTLDPGQVKTAFRRRALQTHPDRFTSCDPIHVREITNRFVEVTDAYKQLNDFIAERESAARKPFPRTRQSAGQRSKPEPQAWRPKTTIWKPKHPQFFSGNIPKRSLRFGEYLYYTGNIPHHSLIEALLWQRSLRPRFGDIALRWRLFSPAELEDILGKKGFTEPVGESAVRLGLLNRYQVNTILFFQRRMQPPIGEYFITNGYLMQFTLHRLLLEHQKHNNQFRSLTTARKAL